MHTSPYRLFIIASLFFFMQMSYADSVIDTRSIWQRLYTARPLASPGTSIATPVAFAIPWGMLIAGVSGQTGTQFTGRPFGEYALGLGIGNPDDVALSGTLTSGGLDEFIRDGNANLQLTKNLTQTVAIAVGVENLLPWGADVRNGESYYAVLSAVLPIIWQRDVFASVGIGNNRFVHNFQVPSFDRHRLRPYLNLAIPLIPQAYFLFDYVGLTYNVGISVTPFVSQAFVISLSANDLTGRGGNHIPIAGTLSYAYQIDAPSSPNHIKE